jgi:hypothetical protein
MRGIDPVQPLNARRKLWTLLNGHLLDDRDWDRLSLLFTPDATFDASDAGGGPATHTLAALIAMFDNPRTLHPLAHYITNHQSLRLTGSGRHRARAQQDRRHSL